VLFVARKRSLSTYFAMIQRRAHYHRTGPDCQISWVLPRGASADPSFGAEDRGPHVQSPFRTHPL